MNGKDESGILAPGHRIAGHVVTRLLGRGAMGDVYEVVHEETGESFALKLLNEEMGERASVVERFRKEAKIMTALDHPHIAKVDASGLEGNRHWLRVELLGGMVFEEGAEEVTTLGDFIDYRGGRLPQDEVQECLRQFLDALRYAHHRGIIHRDLKPANILMHASGMKIADFGIVATVGEEWLRTQVEKTVASTIALGGKVDGLDLGIIGNASGETSLIGTYAYMSPEQKDGLPATAQSDIYAVGLICFHMLTGIKEPRLKLPSQIDSSLDSSWDKFILGTLEKEPSARYADAGAALAALEKVGVAIRGGALGDEGNRKSRSHGVRLASPGKAASRLRGSLSPKKKNNLIRRSSTSYSKSLNTRKKSGSGVTPFLITLTLAVFVACAWVWFEKFRNDSVSNIVEVTDSTNPTPVESEPAPVESEPAPVESVPGSLPENPFATRDLSDVGQLTPSVGPIDIASTSEVTQDSPEAPRSVDLSSIKPNPQLEMLWCKPGQFFMGSPFSEKDRDSDEFRHEVKLTEGFWLGKYEVSQGLWETLMGRNPSHFKGATLPVENVSWLDAKKFCDRLTEVEISARRLPNGYLYSLPTEAQWEYACRSGTISAYSLGDRISSRNANFNRAIDKTHEIASYSPNSWGFHNMHGNVWEWCSDWYGEYPRDVATDPRGPARGSFRVVRGGGWYSRGGGMLRSASRHNSTPGDRNAYLGFRLSMQRVPSL